MDYKTCELIINVAKIKVNVLLHRDYSKNASVKRYLPLCVILYSMSGLSKQLLKNLLSVTICKQKHRSCSKNYTRFFVKCVQNENSLFEQNTCILKI